MREQYFALAQGYAWGRADMGDNRVGSGQAFADAYADARMDSNAGGMRYMPSVQDAYEQWIVSGSIGK